MKSLSPALAAHLAPSAQGANLTTLCHCWRLTRQDGGVLGFTDHDVDVSFDGLVYFAASGFTSSSVEDQLGLAVSNLEVSGVLTSTALSEADLSQGRFDGARIDVFRVNWADPSQRLILRSGSLGAVTRGPMGFRAELRGLSAPLDQVLGRTHTRSCSWSLGNPRCGVDLLLPGRTGAGAVTNVINPLSFVASGLSGQGNGVFTYGLLTWTRGANAGISCEVTGHSQVGDAAQLTLRLSMGAGVVVGDLFKVSWGCDRTFRTCCDRFQNGPNFGGFPHMPGEDFVLSLAHETTSPKDGSVRVPSRSGL